MQKPLKIVYICIYIEDQCSVIRKIFPNQITFVLWHSFLLTSSPMDMSKDQSDNSYGGVRWTEGGGKWSEWEPQKNKL